MQTKREIKYLIVHHSVSGWGDGAVIMAWHTDPKPKGNGWKRPGYHCVITNGFHTYNQYSANKSVAPRVDRIWTEEQSTNGCKYANANALHVCIIGDLDKKPPTAWQMNKLTDLLEHWLRDYNLAPKDIYGHGEMQRKLKRESYSKTCPGKHLHMDGVRWAVAQRFPK